MKRKKVLRIKKNCTKFARCIKKQLEIASSTYGKTKVLTPDGKFMCWYVPCYPGIIVIRDDDTRKPNIWAWHIFENLVLYSKDSLSFELAKYVMYNIIGIEIFSHRMKIKSVDSISHDTVTIVIANTNKVYERDALEGKF